MLSDNREGSYELASHLIQAGHRKLAFIHGEATSVTEKRIAGYEQAMKENAIPLREAFLVAGKYHDSDSSGKATATLLDLKDPPTAIMYPDDFAFLGGMTVIRERGLSIPQDISVTGYDGIGLSRVIQPNLTTWHQNADMIGRLSVRKLVESIEKGKDTAAEQISVSGELFDGYSVRNLDFMKDENESSK